VIDQPLDEMVAAHLRACWAWANSGKKSVEINRDFLRIFVINFYI